MSGGFKFLKYAARRRKALCGTAGVLMSTSVGLKFEEWSSKKKDKIVFLSLEDNNKPSEAEIDSHSSGENRSEPLLPNGDINWSCSCIETEVVGPCNAEFRDLRSFMHENQIKEDLSELGEQKRKMFDTIMEGYIGCTMDHPVYYKETLLDEEREDLEREKQARLAEEEELRLDRESRIQRFGKDTVLFMTEEENKIPSVLKIPERDDLEEYRAPIYSDGTINWACGCIEKDVIGPCNVPFRNFRQFIHDSKQYKDNSMPMEKQRELHSIVGGFLNCARNHPVYYGNLFNKDDDSEQEKESATAETDPPIEANVQ